MDRTQTCDRSFIGKLSVEQYAEFFFSIFQSFFNLRLGTVRSERVNEIIGVSVRFSYASVVTQNVFLEIM